MLVVWIMGINNKTVNNLNNLVELEKKSELNIFMQNRLKKKQDYPYLTFKAIKEQTNLTISKLCKITKVNRDVIKNFLDGKKINHIDYIKILNEFPELQTTASNHKLAISKLAIYGTVIKGGIVRHLFLRENKEFYFIDHLKKVFSGDLICLHDEHTSTKYILQLRTCNDKNHNNFSFDNPCSIFQQEYEHQEFLVKTTTNAYYGVMKRHKKEYYLCDLHTLEPINFGIDAKKPENIIECYDLVVKASDKWTLLKDEKFELIKGAVEDIEKPIE